MPRSRAALLVGIATLAGAPLAPEASAQMSRLWPDTVPPCDGTLQACIDMASAGDEIRLAADLLIDESISFSKRLTLKAEPGHFPVFGAGHSLHGSTSDGGDQTIRIEGVRLEQGSIGSPRIQGHHVDIGAFETVPEPSATFAEVASSVVLAALARLRGEGRAAA